MAFLRDDLAQLTAYQSPHPDEKTAADQTPEPTNGKEAVLPAVPDRLDPLDTNESPIDLPDFIKAALAEQYEQAIAANRYPDSDQLALKRALITYAIQSGSLTPGSITPANITLGNGSDELIRSVIMATCLGGHGSVLVATPTFSMYSILAQTLGVPVRTVARKPSFEVDLTAAQAAIDAAAIDGPPVRVVFMVHPNSPTGNALTPSELTWLQQLPSDILIVVDEAYFEFSAQTTLAEALIRPNWLITRTLSKAFRLAAHRVGYGIGHPDIIAALEKLRLPYNLPGHSQAAALIALAHADQLLTQVPTILTERHKLLSALADYPALQVWPSQGNFVYVRLSNSPKAAHQRALTLLQAKDQKDGLMHLFEQLKAKGTLVRYTGGGLRISIGTAAENQRTLSNLQKIFGYPL